MSNHTPEPWSKNAISPTVYDSDGIAILRCEGRTLIAENEANASRIVACVNACAGIPQKWLIEHGPYAMDKWQVCLQLDAITTQRDELLDLLGKFCDAYENGTPCYEEPDNFDGYIGDAFVLDEEIFGRICEILNQHRIAKCEVKNDA